MILSGAEPASRWNVATLARGGAFRWDVAVSIFGGCFIDAPATGIDGSERTRNQFDLLPALGRLIIEYSKRNQIFVVSHALSLINTLAGHDQCQHFQLEKMFGATTLLGVNEFDLPYWEWPKR